MSFFGPLVNWIHHRTNQNQRPIRRQSRRLFVEALEDRLAPATFAEVELNGTVATANAVTIATGDVLTTQPSAWLIINGAITAADADFYQFTLATASGVFFDIDAQDIGLSALDSNVAVFDSAGVAISGGSNSDGYDFQGFAAPATSVASATSPDSSLYLDLAAGTYYVRVTGSAATTGAYELRLLADSSYTNTVPTLNSNPGAADTLFLDFNGHTNVNDAWATQINAQYFASAFDFNSAPGQFSPAERLAIQNIWRVTSEDFSPFKINVTTVEPPNFNNGVAYRQVITNSNPSIVNVDPTVLGVTFQNNSYRIGTADNIGFVFANNFTAVTGGGISATIMARPIEQGNTASHEFGHALGLLHFASSVGSAGSAASVPSAIMASPDLGLNRETWTIGVNEVGAWQDDLAVIGSAANTFGFRADDYGNKISAASNATRAENGYLNTGILSTLSDRDVFRFTGAGPTTIRVDVDDYVSNLDVELRLYDSAGAPIAFDTPAGSFDGKIVVPALVSGTYYVEIRSDAGAGEVGQYTLTIDTAVTTVVVVAGNLLVTDIANLSKADNLTVSLNGANIRFHDPDNRLLAGVGTIQVDANTVDTPLASITGTHGIVVNTFAGNDSLTLDFSGGNPIPAHGLIYNGGAGLDTLVGNNADNTWNLIALGGGNLVGAGVTFTGIESLTGGTGRDVFRFFVFGRVGGTIDGGAGTNWLDYSSASSVIVNLTTGVASRVTGGVQSINNVIGSALGGSKLTGNAAGGVLLGKGKGNLLTAGTGRGILIGGYGVNTLRGGAADDLLINGRTSYDSNLLTLEAIAAIWLEVNQTYAQRIIALQAAGQTHLGVGTTVFLHPGPTGGLGPRLGDGNFVYQSNLVGNGGNDWFFTKLFLTVLDREADEVVTNSP